MADVFEEVEDQLRAQQLKAFGLKALPWIGAGIGVVLLVVFAVFGLEHLRNRAGAAASDQYAAALEATVRGDSKASDTAFRAVADKGPAAYRALALMQLAGSAIEGGKPADAVKLYDEAAKVAKDPLLSDLARLKSAFALLDTAPYSELESRLTPLTEDKRPYRTEAREALAFAKLMAGNTSGARADFVVLSLLPDSAEDARQRAGAAIEVIDSGTAKALPAAVKAAAALPPVTAAMAPQGLPQ